MARRANSARFVSAVIAAALFAGVADAQTNRTATQAERERRAEAARAERLRRDAEAARGRVEALDGLLADTRLRLLEAERAALDAEHLYAAAQAQIYAQQGARVDAQAALEAALIAAAFADRRDGQDAARSGVFASAAAAEWLLAERNAARGAVLASMAQAQAADTQAALVEAQAELSAAHLELAAALETEQARQAALANAATTAEHRVRALAAEARTLRQLAERVERDRRRGGGGNGNGGGGSGGSVIPAGWLAPAQGSIVGRFGDSREGRPPLQGVMLQTGTGAPVAAPASGEVAYAGVFRSYGQVLILNVDGGYALVLTGLDAISVQVGDRVRAGQPVGTMPASAIPAPELYVEVRRDGRAIDPGAWLNASRDGGARAG